MANVPYDGSGPDVNPETRAPDDYQRIDVNADQFGASIGRGLQQLGQGVEQAQKFQGQVRGDDAYNNYSSQATKILYGDPNKQVAGPDGTMVPDTGYFGLKGSAAVAARASVEQQLNDLRMQGRQGLSPEAALQYDATTRRLSTGNSERLAQHASQQEITYQAGVHAASADNSLTGISVNPLDGDEVAHQTADLINARVNAVRLAGGSPEQQTAAINDAKRDAVRAQVEAIAGTDPSKATEILNAKKDDAGAYYAPLMEKFKARTAAQDGQSLFRSALGNQGQPIPAAPAGSDVPAPAANGLPQEGPIPPKRGDGGAASSTAAGSIQQPTYDAWRGTLSKGDQAEFDTIAKRDAEKNGTDLPTAQAKLYGAITDRATARGHTLPGGQPPAAAPATSPNAADLVHLPQFEAATKVLSSKGASAADKADAQNVVDRWNKQSFPQPGLATTGAPIERPNGVGPMPVVKGDGPLPTLIANKATGRMDTSGAPEIDNSAPGSPAAAPRPPGQNRDTSPTPVAHPSTLALPYFAGSFDNDRSHSLPAPIAGAAALPYFNKAGAAYGISGNYLARTWQIESNSGKNKGSSSAGALGDFQFIPSTWAKYGNGGDRMDFGASTMAAVRLAADNKSALTRGLGRAPTDAELYLAHQQGAAGAIKLLSNPNARAGDIVGNRAVSGNGGDPNMTAGAFVSIWLNKFNGVKPSLNAVPMFASGFGAGTPYYGGPPTAAMMSPAMPDPFQPPPPMAAPASAPAPAPMPPQDQAAPRVQQAPAPPQIAEAPTFRDPKAEVYDRILNSGKSPEVIQHAIQAANQHYAQEQIADEQTQKQRRERSESRYAAYSTAVLQGNYGPQILAQVAADPQLLPETKWTLTKAIREESERGGGGDKETKSYGPGFFDGLKGITAPEGDPSRITSDAEILRRAGPGGDLTFAGAEKLISARKSAERSVSDAAVTRSKAALIDYAKGQLTFDQETVAPGFAGLKDPKGAALFNGTFVPRFEAAFDAHVKAGKDPWEFLTRENVDKQIAGLRSRREMESARMTALGEVGSPSTTTESNPFTNEPAGGHPPPAAPAESAAPAIPAPDGYNAPGWGAVMGQVPKTSAGVSMAPQSWSEIVQMLADDPTPERIERWNKSKWGRAGYDAGSILRQVRPDKAPPLPPAPPPAPMTLDLGQMGP